MKCGIYIWKNLVTKVVLVGQTQNFLRRKSQHLYDLRNNKHHNIHFQRAWNKYGEENFEFEILLECSIDDLTFNEQKYKEEYEKTIGVYNLSDCVEHPRRGIKSSLETRQKISQAHIGKKRSDKHRENISKSQTGSNNNFFGKHHSEETKKKISELKKGHKQSKEAQEKKRIAMKEYWRNRKNAKN